MIQAGNHKHIVEIYQNPIAINPPYDQNEYGEPQLEQISSGEFRVFISPIDGTEDFYTNQGLKNTVTHRIEMRYLQELNLNPEDYIVYEGRHFDIEYITNEDERNSNIVILCTEKLYK